MKNANKPLQSTRLRVGPEFSTMRCSNNEEAGFRSERFPWSVNFRGHSKVSIQLSTEDFYKEFPDRSVPADIHGILMRVASLEDTLHGKTEAWMDTDRRQSKKLKDLGDIARLVENHPHLWELLSPDLKEIIKKDSP